VLFLIFSFEPLEPLLHQSQLELVGAWVARIPLEVLVVELEQQPELVELELVLQASAAVVEPLAASVGLVQV